MIELSPAGTVPERRREVPTPNLVRPSRDGDQFHYLWAARRCLRLLSSQEDLVGIAIEGPSPNELPPESARLRGEEAIDIVEYFGDEDLRRATLVRYIQLKHSSRRAAELWTASGLKKTLIRFSERFQGLLQTFNGHHDVATRFEFWFVTNRPISSVFLEAVCDAAQESAPRNAAETEKLECTTGLHGSRLTQFCRLLRFEDRQDDYWDQRNILFQDVAGYLPDADVYAPVQLKELVTRKALSESENNPVITKLDLLRALNTDEGRLFPARCLIETIGNAVPRAQEAGFVRSIIKAEGRPVIIHAVSGVGKSVLSTRIGDRLPPGSESVLYDCFGNGEYRSATGGRHRHQEALVQIANELAARGLCHPLIPTVHADPWAYLKTFVHRLQQATTVVRMAKPHAILCVVIDAADNAQMAAQEFGESRSFVRDLLRVPLPDGVRLVVLCRSHRQSILDPPHRALRLRLEPFTKSETAKHLRRTHPDATDVDVEEFHRLSSENPRVQALALSAGVSLARTLRRLGPNPTTVDDSIQIMLSDTIAILRDKVSAVERQSIGRLCAALAALRPLVPISILSDTSGLSEDSIRSLVLDIGRPLLLLNDSVQFRDEPVETWFREKFKPNKSELDDFIRSLMPFARVSAYVASTLPQLMLEAGQLSQLVDWALHSMALPETSELEKYDVELHRLQFALKASLRARRYLDAAKLALKAGGISAGDDRQRTLIQAHTDLAARFLGPEKIQEMVSRRIFGSGWMGSHHAYEAGLLSGCDSLVAEGRSRLRMAYDWLGSWSRLTPEEREEESVDVSDIAELTMAEQRIHGPRAAVDSLRSWRPLVVSVRAAQMVAGRLIDHGRIATLNDLAEESGDDIWLVIAITGQLRQIQHTPPKAVVERTIKSIFNLAEASSSTAIELGDVLDVLEAGLKLGVCSHAESAALLAEHLPEAAPRGLAVRPSRDYTLLRGYSLLSAVESRPLRMGDLAYPELKAELKKESEHLLSQEAREFKQDIGGLLPWYGLWNDVLLGKVTKGTLSDRLRQARDSTVATSTRSRDELFVADEIAVIWFEVLMHLGATAPGFVDSLASWIRGLRRPLYTPTLTRLARQASWTEETRAFAIDMANRAFTRAQGERTDAETKACTYIEIARSVLVLSEREAKGYFDEAVVVAANLGEENLRRWGAMLDLADRAGDRNRSASPEVAYQFARCGELTWDYVARDKHFDWRSTLVALSSLCLRSSLAILSRWRDRGFGSTERNLPIAVHTMIERKQVDPRDALTLIGIKAEWNYPDLLSSALDKCTIRVEKEAAVSFLLRHLEETARDSSVWDALKRTVAKHDLSVPEIDKSLARSTRHDRATMKHSTRHRKRSGIDDPRECQWDDIFSQKDLTTVDGISGSLIAFRQSDRPWDRDEFFFEAICRVPVGGEAEFSSSIGSTPALDLYDLRSFLEQVPDRWKKRPAVRSALSETLKSYCRRYCMKIDRNRYYEVLPFDLACQLTGLSEGNIAEAVLDAISESPALAESERLFSMVGLLKSRIDPDDALDALRFGLSLYDQTLETKDGDGPWSQELSPPTSIDRSIAGYVYSGLGAPSAATRWQVAHVVLGLCALGRGEVLGHLVSFEEGDSPGPFADARLPFYQLHARQWLLIALARAAADYPEILAGFARRIIEIALVSQPHALSRMFAARAALALIKNGVLRDGDLADRLSRVNVSSLPTVESTLYTRERHQAKETTGVKDEDRFYFGLDTGRYWYEPLARVFALSSGEIKREALRVIRDELNFDGKDPAQEDPRAVRRIYDYPETYASHGSYPDTDDLQFYLSYHAMMIVAGRLLAQKPTHRDPEDEQNEFAEWLSRHDVTRKDGRWLADRRDPAPLGPLAWCEREKTDPQYGIVTLADFEQALTERDRITVWGYWSTVDSSRLQRVHVWSALVSADRSMALFRALRTARDNRSYAIPSAGDYHEIDRGGFLLKGWISDRGPQSGLDEKDTWSGGVVFPPHAPAKEIADLMSIKSDEDQRIWYDHTRRPVMFSQVWGQLQGRNDNYDVDHGEKLQTSRSFIDTMLRKLGHDLIVEIRIERRGRRWGYETREDDNGEVPETTRLYVFECGGTVTTI